MDNNMGRVFYFTVICILFPQSFYRTESPWLFSVTCRIRFCCGILWRGWKYLQLMKILEGLSQCSDLHQAILSKPSVKFSQVGVI